jgi:hypothetical protein
MAKALLLAWASPVSEESDADFNGWYNTIHIPQVQAAIPSITAVNRYRLAAVDPAVPAAATRYLAIYELDDADVSAASEALGGAMAGGRLDLTAAMDVAGAPPVTQWYQHV